MCCSASSAAWATPPPVWLSNAGRGVKVAEHEKGARAGVRGHVLEKHVGKSHDWLRERAIRDGLALATSFDSEESADAAVDFCMGCNKVDIAAFINGTKGPNKEDFWAPTKHPVGYGVRPDGSREKKIRGVKIVLTRQGGGQWQILTAHPSLTA